jgi:hypothetical protein
MNCLMAEEHFSAYLEDELAYQTIKEFETHLTECGSCSSEFVTFRKSVSLIHQLPRIEPSSDFDRMVQSRVGNLDVDRIPAWHQILDSLRARPVWAFSGIATILLVVLVSAYFYQSGLDGYRSSAPRIVIDTDSNPGYRRVERMENQELLALPVRQVNVPLDIGNGVFFEGEVLERRPQRTQQNFILQTVNYSSTPRGGGL